MKEDNSDELALKERLRRHVRGANSVVLFGEFFLAILSGVIVAWIIQEGARFASSSQQTGPGGESNVYDVLIEFISALSHEAVLAILACAAIIISTLFLTLNTTKQGKSTLDSPKKEAD